MRPTPTSTRGATWVKSPVVMNTDAHETELCESVEHGEWKSIGRQVRARSRYVRYAKGRFAGIAG